MSFTLYGHEGNPRAQIVRIVAAAESIDINIIEVVPATDIGTEAYIAKFPRSRGKIPGLEAPNVKLTEILAIITYLAKLSNKAKLLGDGTLEQEASVLSWMSWVNQELTSTLSSWYLPSSSGEPAKSDNPNPRILPLMPKSQLPTYLHRTYNHSAVSAGKENVLKLLDVLEDHLCARDYLVGDHITAADIMVIVIVSLALACVLDVEWRGKHPNIVKHFDVVSRWEYVKAVIPEFVLVEKELPNVDPHGMT